MILLLEQLLPHIQRRRKAGQRIVFTNGCFDLLHLGHITYLRMARLLGDCLIVGLNSDSSVQRLKGPGRPIIPENERAALLDSLQMVDYVVLFSEDTPKKLIEQLRPDVLVKGGDYRPHQIAGADVVAAAGGSIVILPYLHGKSTTAIVRKICATICRTES